MEEEARPTSQEEAKKDQSPQVRHNRSRISQWQHTDRQIANKLLTPPQTHFRTHNIKLEPSRDQTSRH
jgi:hypothetical protein